MPTDIIASMGTPSDHPRDPPVAPVQISNLELLTQEFSGSAKVESWLLGSRRAQSYESGLNSHQPENSAAERQDSTLQDSTLSAKAIPFRPGNVRRKKSGSSTGSITSLPARRNWSNNLPSHTSPRMARSPLQPFHVHMAPYKRPDTFSHFEYQHKPRPTAYHIAQGDANGALQQGLFDPYVTSTSPLPTTHHPHQSQLNPYAQDPTSGASAQFYQSNSYQQPLQYHLYTSLGPFRENLMPYQRAAHDFFIPDALREDLQRKSAATLQTLPSRCLIVRDFPANHSRFYSPSADRSLPFSCSSRHYKPEKCNPVRIS